MTKHTGHCPYPVPSVFIFFESLPRNPNGKIDRAALPAPEDTQPQMQEGLVPPRTPVEEWLAGCWKRLLRLQEVGVNHDFFELGGHSLLATRMVNRVRKEYSIQLPLRGFFAAPTIAGLAACIEEARGKEMEDAAAVAQLLDQVMGLSESEVRSLVERT